MSGFLEQMAAASRERALAAMAGTPLAGLRSLCRDLAPAPSLARAGRFDLIAELKLRSPALGELARAGEDLAGRVETYARAGAAAVSVLTEPSRFSGSLDHLRLAAATLSPLGVPAMRKDFLVDPYQLYEARAAGAGGALVIVRMLSRRVLEEMLDCAGELGLFLLIETFDSGDIAIAGEVVGRVPASGLPCEILVGVNSRDLQTLEVAPERLEQLAPLLPQACLRVAESGLTEPEDAARMARAGYQLALVGGALMSAPAPEALLAAMLAAGRAAAT